MEDKKYELTNKIIKHGEKTLYQIRALKDFEDVNTGDLGGYIESERNLSHEGNCWVYENAKVYEKLDEIFEEIVWLYDGFRSGYDRRK